MNAPQIGCLFLLLAFAPTTLLHAENRTYDGVGNNLANVDWGAANTQLSRIATPDYGDGIASMAGATRPNPRDISNAVGAIAALLPNNRHLRSYVWQWGQFLDHDIDLMPGGGDAADIAVPTGDPDFDPMGSGAVVIPFSRSMYDMSTGTSISNPRQQVNAITSFIDASNVYGSSEERANALRSNIGGRLLMSGDGLLPVNTMGLPNANDSHMYPDEDLAIAGDVRANEQVGLTAMHTLFVREHNRLAAEIEIANPGWSDEQIYQRSRKIVGAQMQVITYQEFLPAVLGPYAPGVESVYDESVNPSISNEFATAIYRLGHSMIGEELMRVQNDGQVAPGGHLSMMDAFFNPTILHSSEELDFILKGLSVQQMREVDTSLVDDLRNFLFGPPGAGGFDLLSLNLQRGRDHGLPDYNSVRAAYGLPERSFEEISSDPIIVDALVSLYDNDPSNIDLWVGALAEDHMPGASAGELLTTGIVDQFVRLRDGDRFWYRNDADFTDFEIQELEATRLSDIIIRNTGIDFMQERVMLVPEPPYGIGWLVGCLAFVARWSRSIRKSLVTHDHSNC
ncbi:MAG: peroxidase family protein [Planctomycetales bacterium]|nr:peroxidase family protein [Planctomycetales bacterium]